MSYREPGVKVSQEFVNALPALATFALPNVNVGPTFQVVKQGSAGKYVGGQADFNYPGQIMGTVLDTRPADPSDLTSFPIRVFVRNPSVQIVGQMATGSVSTADLNSFTDPSQTVFANNAVKPGDVLVIHNSNAGNNGAYTVRAITDGSTVSLNETLVANETAVHYIVVRTIPKVVELTSDSGISIGATVHFPQGVVINDDVVGNNLTLAGGDILISYRALRMEKAADVAPYSTTADLQADFGLDQIVPENPAVFATFLALNNSATETNLLALHEDYLTDELIAYSKAFDVLTLADMYAISVLTQNTSVHTSLKSHVETMSQADKKLERVGIVNRKLVTSSVVVDTAITHPGEGLTTDGILTSSESHFLTDGVVPGMFVNITAPPQRAGRLKILAVNSQTQLVVDDSANIGGVGLSFSIEKDLTKNDQANILAAYAASLGSRRLVMTWPDVVKIPVGATIRPLPGYFLNAAVGALTTGLPTQQGFTNLSVGVYQGVVHSTKYFTGDQLNLLAAGGVMIFVQDVLDQTALYIRHQLTTDTSAIKFQEYSITKNVDFIAKFIRNNHKSFIGKYNIVDTTFDDLKANAAGIMKYLKDNTKRPKIGGVIRSGKLITIEQDPANIDSIVERYSLDIPVPLNNLDITVVV